MGVELRKGRPYLYDRRQVNGRRRVEYHGPASPAEVQHARDEAAVKRNDREHARWEVESLARTASSILATGAELDHLADRVFRSVMHLAGYHQHHRSTWRRKRGSTMSLDSILAQFGPKEPATPLVRHVPLDPAHKDILDRAAKGDFAVLPEVEELFNDARYVSMMGGVATMARVALIGQVAGDDVAVALATEKKFNEYLDKLEGDGPEPTFAERLTITRAAHNWLAVHILECLMNQYELWGARAAALDKSLGRAERRLHASLQALAMLRRLRRPVVKQVNVANGPMLVNN